MSVKRAFSVENVLKASFNTLPFEGEWKAAVGCPEKTGSWFVYGPPKNGKTSFAMQLAKYLCGFCRVAFNSVEEGFSQSIQNALNRTDMGVVARKFVLLDREDIAELTERLSRRKSPDVVIIDSVQFLGLTFEQYKLLKGKFPHKLFVFISHVEGKLPDGNVAKRIWRDANVVFRVEGFKALPVSRYGGGTPYIVSQERAAKYWALDSAVDEC